MHHQLRPDRPFILWVQDIAQHHTIEWWVNTATVIGTWPRHISGLPIADHRRVQLVVDPFEMARQGCDPEGIAVHWDHGAQYV